jgi:HEAT repeat protein
MALLVAVGILLGVAFHQSLSDWFLLWRMHRAADHGEPLDPFVKQVAQHDDAVDVAARLSTDPDPRVRREMVAVLVADATPAHKVERRFGAFSESWTGMHTRAVPALKRLLADPDPEVRRQALRTVAGLRAVEDFSDPLLHTLHEADTEDRVIVAESLAHWNPDEFLKTFADPAQPREVRLAVLRGAEKYGWARVADREDKFQEALKQMVDDPDDELRHEAIYAARYARPHDAVALWLGVIAGKRVEERRLALDTWIDAVANEETFPGENYPILEATESLQFGDIREAGAGRLALVIHVVCAAARINMRELDRAAPVNWQQALADRDRGGPAAAAFVVELHRLQQILRAVGEARAYARSYPGLRFTAWLPDEDANGPPPTRSLKDYLLEQAREPLAWCRNHGGGYASPFLRLNGFRYEGEDPGRGGRQARTLGEVLKDLRLDTDEALASSLKPDVAP